MLQSETVRKYNTYKDSGIEWIGEIPQNWDRTRLKRLLSTPITDGPHETPELLDNGIPFLSAEAVKNNKLNFDLKRGYISHEEHLRFCKKCKPQLNDIFMIKSGATTGNVAIVDTTEEFSIWSPLALIRADESILYFKYLFYYLQSYVFKNQVELFWSYGTQQNIGMEVLGNLYIAFSKMITEQQHIAEYLDKKCDEIDRVVETEKSVIEKLKDYKQSIITEAVTKGLDKSVSLKDSGIEWIGKIPQHWEVRKLKTIGDYRNGLTYSPEDMCEEENGTLVLRSSNIKGGKLVLNDNVYVSSEIPTVLKVQKGDILVCSRNGSKDLIGKNAIIDSDINASFGAFMMIFRCSCPRYMYYILNSHVFNYYLGSFFTSTINQLTGKNFGGMDIVFCPDKTEQEQIVNHLDKKCLEIDKAIADKEQVIEKFTEYKKSLIYECVTGKRKVV